VSANESAANWIAKKLGEDPDFTAVDHVGSGILEIARKGGATFKAAALGIDDVVRQTHIAPLVQIPEPPEFIVNLPSKGIWEGGAIELVHRVPAAFGGLGDLVRASRDEPVYAYRNKQDQFFEQAFTQHSAVRKVTRVYDRLYHLERRRNLSDIMVVLVDAYDMSSEDVRHARDVYGRYDAAVKMTSYGSVTISAREAAESMGAGAFKFGELMGRLNRS